MPNRSNLFQDLSRLAGDAANTLGSVRTDVEAAVKQRFERMLEDCDLVRRDEFDAVQAMAAAAREEQDKLHEKIAELEAKIDALSSLKPKASPRKPAAKKATTKKTAESSSMTDA